MWKCPKCGRGFNREGQSHFCGKIETIDQYIEEQEEKARPYLNEVRQILRAAIPEAEEKISWSMPTFWKGRNIIHFAASKKLLQCLRHSFGTSRTDIYRKSHSWICLNLPASSVAPKALIISEEETPWQHNALNGLSSMSFGRGVEST